MSLPFPRSSLRPFAGPDDRRLSRLHRRKAVGAINLNVYESRADNISCQIYDSGSCFLKKNVCYIKWENVIWDTGIFAYL